MLAGRFTFFRAIWKILKNHLIVQWGPVFPMQAAGFCWVAQFGVVNYLNLLCCVPTSCMYMAIVALHWKVGVKLGEVGAASSMRSAPRLF